MKRHFKGAEERYDPGYMSLVRRVTGPKGHVALLRVLDFSRCEINFAGVRIVEVRPSISTDPNPNPNPKFGPVTLPTSDPSDY